MDIQRVGAQELDVNVVPADVFEQDKTDPKNPVLRLRDWLLDILSLRVASATLTNATISQATVSSADITTLTTPTAVKVTNLNADLLDGYHAGNNSNNVPINNGILNTSLNADQLDGYHAGNGSGNVPISNGTTNINLVAEKAITAWELKLQTTYVSTVLQSDACLVEVAVAGAITLTISSGLPIGHQYRIKRTVSSSNGITINCSGSETVEGLTSFTIQGSKVSAVLDTGEVVVEKVSNTAWSFVGGQISGSNSNGYWIKFSDGTLEQWGSNARSIGNTVAYGTGTYAQPTTNFPTAFISTDYSTNVTVRVSGRVILTSIAFESITTTSAVFYYWDPRDTTAYSMTTLTEKWYAIGRWK